MSKLSKLLTIAIVVLAVITMSVKVNASEGTDILTQYIREPQNINGMIFELKNNQKDAISDYIAKMSDADARAVHGKIVEAANLVRKTNATSLEGIDAHVKAELITMAKDAAKIAGLTLTVNTANNTYTVAKANGEVLASGKIESSVTYAGASNGGSTSTKANSSAKLLYTGSNYEVYAGVVLAIVAVAVVVKKRV